MPDGLYERDTLLWSEQQADLLRRLAAARSVNLSRRLARVLDATPCGCAMVPATPRFIRKPTT